ncbi:MAG: AbrB/MazE/SpoVT family DNA-binding domain-containing protein [Terriglobales bacterium]
MDATFTTVSSKGQIVIPAELRNKLGIEAGTRIAIQQQENHLILHPITETFIDSLMGCCKGGESLVAIREREHRNDK